MHITYGFPQRTVFGPIFLLIIYNNSLLNKGSLKVISYANDYIIQIFNRKIDYTYFNAKFIIKCIKD